MEDQPERCGEICLVEVFGDSAVDESGARSVEVGSGVHAFRDPALREEFSAPCTPLDITTFHRYAVDWRADGVDFMVDGEVVRRSKQSPDYPMLLVIAVFDFPERARPEVPEPVHELVVRRVGWSGGSV